MQTVAWLPDQPFPPRIQHVPRTGADKYHGEVATGYTAKRENDPKWIEEDRVIRSFLADLPKGAWVLDVPCGNGRFFDFYAEKGFLVRGIDKSESMLKEIQKKGLVTQNVRFLSVGDVRQTGLQDKCVDAAVMVRLTRWLSVEDCILALRELMRVTRKRVIFTARVRNHVHARSYEEVIYPALEKSVWRVHRDEAGYHEDYRIIELRPA